MKACRVASCCLADTSWQKEPNAPQREAYGQAELHIRIAQSDVDTLTTEQIAGGAVPQILGAIDQLITQDPNLCGKKGVYVKFGCRGDWPDLQMPDADVKSALSGMD